MPLITRFIAIVASGVAGVLLLAFAFVLLAPRIQRLLGFLFKTPSSTDPR